jgi:hypothetical protein
MAAASLSLWHYLLTPGAAMDAADAMRLRPAMTRLALLTSPATADWLLAPLLPPGIAALPPEDVLRDRLRTRYLRAEARRWLAVIAGANIPVLPIKGFATGLALYPDAELRGLGDVDLLTRSGDLPELAALLRLEGFVFRPSLGTPFWGHSGEASFHPCVAPDGQLSFDLHIAPDEHPLPRSLTADMLFAGARAMSDGGMSMLVPRDSHLLLMAASHAARDKYDPNAARSLIDLVVMQTRAARPADWRAALAVADAGGNERLLRLAAQLLIGLGLSPDGLPPALTRPYRGLAGREMARMIAQFTDMFAALPSKLALQRREWLLTGGLPVAARRSARRLRGMIRPWSGFPPS